MKMVVASQSICICTLFTASSGDTFFFIVAQDKETLNRNLFKRYGVTKEKNKCLYNVFLKTFEVLIVDDPLCVKQRLS